MSHRLALGTVQFGLAYGIANQSGQVAPAEASAILEYAAAQGLDTLDTAMGYGDSERQLGEIGIARWQVVTKLPALPEACPDVAGWVHAAVAGSLQRLAIPRLRGLLLHRPQQLLGPQGDALYRALLELKAQGMVEKIGVSIYDPAELDVLWSRFRIDLVQAPLNVLDRRLASSGWLRRLHDEGTEIHVRSIFLQGLLLMGAASRPPAFDRWSALWADWHRWLEEQNLAPLQACLGFVMAQTEVDRVVVGVDNLKQLQEILLAVTAPTASAPPTLATGDLALINPSNWPHL